MEYKELEKRIIEAEKKATESAEIIGSFDFRLKEAEKRIKELIGITDILKLKVTTEVSSATPTINTDRTELHSITALGEAVTSMTTNLKGNPKDGQGLIIRALDDGTARAITWGDSFEDAGVALPGTTVISKLLTVVFKYNSVTGKFGCILAVSET